MIWLAVVLSSPVSCTLESGAVGEEDSTLEDCEDGFCTENDEECYDGSRCSSDDTDCASDDYDDLCHKDCTEDESCADDELCVHVGSEVWLCL